MVEAKADFTAVVMHEKPLLFSFDIHSDFFVLNGIVELESISIEFSVVVKSSLTDTFVAFVILEANTWFQALLELSEVYCSGWLRMNVVFGGSLLLWLIDYLFWMILRGFRFKMGSVRVREVVGL